MGSWWSYHLGVEHDTEFQNFFIAVRVINFNLVIVLAQWTPEIVAMNPIIHRDRQQK